MDSKKELKTLKEIELLSATQRYVIKQEAIKWVKHIRRICPAKYTMENDFTKFFNITEEDLK